jgi:23S rRNA (guanosine2251-2'-O)-methyltransferase
MFTNRCALWCTGNFPILSFLCRVKPYRQQKQQTRPKKNLLVLGKDAVVSAMSSGKQMDRIYIRNNLYGREMDGLLQTASKMGVPVNKVPEEKLKYFNAEGHNGVIGVLSTIHYHSLQDVISLVVEKGETPLFLMLDGITDIRNIGGIARTAFCCGVHALIIPEKGVGALNEDATQTSAGALEKLTVCRVNSLMKAVDELHLNGIKVFASEMTAEKNIADCVFTEPCAIVMGGEENGVYPALMKICDEKMKIPMKGEFESLNVSVATGMILYEAMRQRT